MLTHTGPDESASQLTPRAQQVLALAQKEADRFNHNFVGTEHMLLGLIKLGQGVAVSVLRKQGLDLETVRMEVEKQVGTGPDQKMRGNIPYTPRVMKVLALAAKEAKALNHTYVGTEHILLGLLREGDGVAARVLKNLDVDIKRTRLEILRELVLNFSPDEARPGELASSRQKPWKPVKPMTLLGLMRSLFWKGDETGKPESSHEESEQFREKTGRTKTPGPGAETLTPQARFTPRAHKVMALAREEAGQSKQSFVGAEHLLLGLIKLGQGVAVTVLAKAGLDLETVRREVEKTFGIGADQNPVGNLSYTPRVKEILAVAAKEADSIGHTYVGTEHILLGILSENQGAAAQVLKNLGVDAGLMRQEILRELAPSLEPEKPKPEVEEICNDYQEAEEAEAKAEEKELLKHLSGVQAPSILQFNPQAQKALALAAAQARRLNHEYVGCEHLLLGLTLLEKGIATDALKKFGLDQHTVCATEGSCLVACVEAPRPAKRVPYTPRLKQVFKLAIDEAEALKAHEVGPEHLLLGMLREGGGAPEVIFRNRQIDPAELRKALLAAIQ